MVFVGLKTYVNYLPRSALSSSNNLTPCSCESKILKDQIDLPVLINLFLQRKKGYIHLSVSTSYFHQYTIFAPFLFYHNKIDFCLFVVIVFASVFSFFFFFPSSKDTSAKTSAFELLRTTIILSLLLTLRNILLTGSINLLIF